MAAMTTVATQTIARQAGAAVTLAAAASGGNRFLANGRTFLVFVNATGGSTIVATIVSVAAGELSRTGNKTVSIPATGKPILVWPFPNVGFQQPSGDDMDYVQVTFDGVVGLEVGAVQAAA